MLHATKQYFYIYFDCALHLAIHASYFCLNFSYLPVLALGFIFIQSPPTLSQSTRLKLVLLLISSMTVMAGATIAPSLPGIKSVFAHESQAEVLAKLVLTLPALFIALFAPLSGFILDRFGRKRLLVGASLLYALAGTSGFYLDNLYLILVGRALLGIAVAGIMTTATTLVGDYFEGEVRSKFLGIQAAFMALGGAVFVTLGGYLADLSWRYPFLIYASAIAIIPMIIMVIYEPGIISNQGEGADSDLSYPRARVAVVYALAFLGMVMFYMVPVQIPFLLEGFPDISKTQIGMAISIATLTAALASSSYRRLREKLTFMQIYAFTFILMALAFLFISQASSYAEVLGGLAIAGLGAGLLMPNSNLWIISLAPAPLRGRLVGGITMSVFLGQFFSPILVEPLSGLASLPLAFAVAAVLMAILGTVLGFYGFRLSRHRETQS